MPLVTRCREFMATLLCWSWFIFGFLFIFSWCYAVAALRRDRERAFQRLNCRFFRVFFRLLRWLAPGHHWDIDAEVAGLRSSVVVCNHQSYLDPLLLITLFAHHRTIAKTRFFPLPIFGWIMKNSGYIPASGEGRFAALMLQRMESMQQFLRDGGILFVFPEGTRSRDGHLGGLQRGALKIARLYQAPVQVLRLTNTDKLFPPGRFCFNTTAHNTIRLSLVERIAPEQDGVPLSAAQLEARVGRAFGRAV